MPRLSLVSTSPAMGRHDVSIVPGYVRPSGLSVGCTVKRYFICRDDSAYGSLIPEKQEKTYYHLPRSSRAFEGKISADRMTLSGLSDSGGFHFVSIWRANAMIN